MEKGILNIHDNLLQDEFLYNLDKKLEYGEWKYNCTGGESKKFPYDNIREYKFWGLKLWEENFNGLPYINSKYTSLTDQLFKFINFYNQKFTPELNLKPYFIHCNGQTIGQDGHCHLDIHDNSSYNYYSLMIMINLQWDKDWGGQFEILENESNDSKVVKNIGYKAGRVIFFDGNYPHRGIAPIIPNVLRKTLIIKLMSSNII